MKDFPSCFGENGVQVADSSSSSTARAAAPQNLVTCVYQCDSQEFSGFITVTWIKYLMGQGVSISIENSTKKCHCKAEIKPWLFSRRKGFKKLIADSTMVDIHWDLSSAKFGSSPEPLEGFYLSIALNQEHCLLLGDLEHKNLSGSSEGITHSLWTGFQLRCIGMSTVGFLARSTTKQSSCSEAACLGINNQASCNLLCNHLHSEVSTHIHRFKASH